MRHAEGKGKQMEGLANKNSHVLLVKIIEGNRLDHIICIESYSPFILEDVKPCPLRLSEEDLQDLSTLNQREV